MGNVMKGSLDKWLLLGKTNENSLITYVAKKSSIFFLFVCVCEAVLNVDYLFSFSLSLSLSL